MRTFISSKAPGSPPRPAACLAAALLLAIPAPAAARETLPAAAAASPVAPPAAPPEVSADFEALLGRLAERARLYRAYALGFTCEESVIRSFYDPEQGSFRRRDRELYDYLFERSEKTGRLGEIREILEENGKPVRRTTRDLELEIPPSYAWSQIFAEENRGRFHFRPAGRVLKGYRLLIQIDFVGWAAEPGKAEISGWSGRASVDSTTLNLHSIEAEPAGQTARIEAERMKYQRAFAIMGVPLASRPRTRALSVVLSMDHEGLTYPTETNLTKSVYVRSAEQGLEERIVLRYRNYRFFRVGTAVEAPRPEPIDPNTVAPPEGTQGEPADPNGPGR